MIVVMLPKLIAMVSPGNAEETETVQQIENVTGYNLSSLLHDVSTHIYIYILFQVPLYCAEIHMHWCQEQGQAVPCLKIIADHHFIVDSICHTKK